MVKLQLIYNQFLNFVELITYWEKIAKKKHENIISIMRLGITLYLSVSWNIEQTFIWVSFLQTVKELWFKFEYYDYFFLWKLRSYFINCWNNVKIFISLLFNFISSTIIVFMMTYFLKILMIIYLANRC